MMQILAKRDYIILLISVLLLIDGIDNVIEYIVAFLLSLSLYKKPEAYIPLIWVSSWYSRMIVLPFIGAFYYYSLLFLLSSFSQNRFTSERQDNHNLIIVSLFFVLWIIVNLLFAIVPEYDIVIKLVVAVLLFVSIFKIHLVDIEGIGQSIIYISILSSVFFAFRLFFSPIVYSVESIMDWGTYIYSSTTFMPELNPNTAAQIIVFISIVLSYSIIKNKKYFLTVPLLLNFYTLLELGSRTSFFTLLLVFGIYFLLISKQSIIQKISIIILVLFAYFVFVSIWGDIAANSRIANESILEDGGSGRFFTWTSLLMNVFPRYWYCGIGIGRNGYNALGYIFDADNLYIDLLCQIGIIGFLLFFSIYFIVFKLSFSSLKNGTSNQEYSLLFLIAFLFLGIGETVFATPIYWATLILVVALDNDNTQYIDFN